MVEVVQSGRILVTGGAGFVGANLAVALAGRGRAEVVAFDNLSRRGSERNVARLEGAGAEFVHGDLHEKSELLALDHVDAIVECSAEQSSLMSVYHCLELARRDDAQVIFMSTSRVYPLRHLLAISSLANGSSIFSGNPRPTARMMSSPLVMPRSARPVATPAITCAFGPPGRISTSSPSAA